MASVQELIAAAQHNTNARKSPFMQLAEGFMQGTQTTIGNESGLEQIKREMDIQAAKDQQRRQEEMDREIRQKLAADSESRVQNSLNKVSGAKPATPQHKLKETLKQDATGRWTRALEEVSTEGAAGASGAHPVYTPAQIEAISSGDPRKLSSAFPEGVPDAAVKATYGGERIANLEAERSQRETERMYKEKQNIVDTFNAHPQIKRAAQSIDSANTVRGLIDSDSPIAAASIPTYMARAAGEVGALSEADKAPFGGSRALMEKWGQTIKNATAGTLTEDNKQFLRDIVTVMEKKANENMDRLARERALQKSKSSRFKDPAEIFAELRPNSEWAPKAAPTGDPAAAAALKASVRTKLGLGPEAK